MSTVNDLEHGHKSPKQMLKYCAMVLAVPVIVIIFLIKMNLSDFNGEERSLDEESVAMRIQPVAKYNTGVALVVADSGKPKEPLTGEAVFKKLCTTCHTVGLAGAPKLGDSAAWAPRLAAGQDDVFGKALKGFNGMPAKGGDASLSDLEVKRAVVWMANQSGGKFEEPAADAK